MQLFSLKKILVAILVVGALFYFGNRAYRYLHPEYIPLPPRPEVTLTLIPGWNLRQVAEYLVLKGVATSTDAVYALAGTPASYQSPMLTMPVSSDVAFVWDTKPSKLSWEGYLAPETIRFFADASLEEVLTRFIKERGAEVKSMATSSPMTDRNYSWHTLLTMASIVEKEVKHNEDRAKVADILWRRYKKNWALQVDSSVHYVVDRTGDVFTTGKERSVDSPWNTYKYPGLPPGPICNPSVESIKATLNPESNEYWYFLSGSDGTMHYAKTLEEHNRNKKYL